MLGLVDFFLGESEMKDFRNPNGRNGHNERNEQNGCWSVEDIGKLQIYGSLWQIHSVIFIHWSFSKDPLSLSDQIL